MLTQGPAPQNGQLKSNNSSAKADKYLSVFDHLVDMMLTGWTTEMYIWSCQKSKTKLLYKNS